MDNWQMGLNLARFNFQKMYSLIKFVEDEREVNFRVFRINIIIYSSLSSEDSLLLIRLLPVRVFPLFGPGTVFDCAIFL